MKKFLTFGLSVAVLTLLAFAKTEKKVYDVKGLKFSVVSKDSSVFKKAQNAPLFKKFNSKVTKVMKVNNGLYYLKVERAGRYFDFFWDKDKNAFFNTSVFLTYDGKVIKVPIIIDADLVKKVVAFTYGKGTKELYLVTDPQCPFCKRLEFNKGEKLAEHYKIHTVLFPLSFHDRALPLVQWILKAKTDKERRERMLKAMKDDANPEVGKALGFKHWNDKEYHKELEKYREIVYGMSNDYKPYFKSEKELKKFREYLNNVKKFVNQAQVRGTPTVMNKNFQQVNPYSLAK
jgi:thiol:disulfide interchange protein DsbC